MQAGLTRRRLTERKFLFEGGLSGVEECSIRALRLGPVRQGSCLANGSGSLTTFNDGSTRGNASLRAHLSHSGIFDWPSGAFTPDSH